MIGSLTATKGLQWQPQDFTWDSFTKWLGEGNGNPLQCSCLENPRDRGAWWAAIYGVTQSQTWLNWLSSSSSTEGLGISPGCIAYDCIPPKRSYVNYQEIHKIIIPNKPFSVYMKTITNTLAEYLLITKSLQKQKQKTLSQTFNFLYYSEPSTPTGYLLSIIVWFRFGFNLLCQCIFPLPLLKYVKL